MGPRLAQPRHGTPPNRTGKQKRHGDQSGLPYAEIAQKHGLTENTVKVSAHRLRQRNGRLLRGEISRTVDTAKNVEAELRYLIQVIGS